jgi:hypothetical protein
LGTFGALHNNQAVKDSIRYSNPIMRFLSTLAFCSPLLAQSFQIVPSTAPHGRAGSLLITLTSPAGKEPVALQWKIALGSEVAAEPTNIVAGDAAIRAGKSATCKPVQDNLAFICILAGGKKPIANGTIFLVKYKIKPKTKPHTLAVRISDGIAVLQLQKVDIPPAEGTITVR